MTSHKFDDPFGEQTHKEHTERFCLLGCDFTVECSDIELLDLVNYAFGDLPPHVLDGALRKCKVTLVLTHQKRTWARNEEPPRLALSSGNELLCGSMDSGNFAVIDVKTSRALVCISAAMLDYPYHARYELIEFAFLTLASRVNSLLPLHAACVGNDHSGILLMGASGSGKSTVSLHAIAAGLRLVSEDSALVTPASLMITGVPRFVYVQRDSVKFLKSMQLRKLIRKSPVIQRRSGVRKYQAGLQEIGCKTAPTPLQLVATVTLTRQPVKKQPALKRIGRRTFLTRLRREQPYASGMPNWTEFERRIADLPAYELRRTMHPDIAVQELKALLG